MATNRHDVQKTKYESISSKQKLNYKEIKTKPFYDLEGRTLEFSKRVIRLCKALPRNYINNNIGNQLIRSGTSIGANYREANESDTKKDFKHRIRISKKEAKETIYWLELVVESNQSLSERITPLLIESTEIMKILGSIYEKANKGN